MFEQAFRNVDDALRKEAGCAPGLDYAKQTFWLLFLKDLDGLELCQAHIPGTSRLARMWSMNCGMSRRKARCVRGRRRPRAGKSDGVLAP
jgi:hypothetical protein